MILHEDAKYTLPVFGGCVGTDNDTTDKEDILEVICVFGAVRDMRRAEEEAVRRAAESLQMRSCCICNLGRTAGTFDSCGLND